MDRRSYSVEQQGRSECACFYMSVFFFFKMLTHMHVHLFVCEPVCAIRLCECAVWPIMPNFRCVCVRVCMCVCVCETCNWAFWRSASLSTYSPLMGIFFLPSPLFVLKWLLCHPLLSPHRQIKDESSSSSIYWNKSKKLKLTVFTLSTFLHILCPGLILFCLSFFYIWKNHQNEVLFPCL